jgi:excisionase family DNA binding protein
MNHSFSRSPSDQPKLAVSAREAAAMLGVSERLLWSKTKNGEIPCVRLGTRVLYSIAKLSAWLENQGPQR